jgi:hypothetical protein
MSPSTSQILRRHDDSLDGTLLARRIESKALRISKPFFVYEPPGLEDMRGIPVLYLFRGHQREWVNMREDDSRIASTAIEDLDKHIAEGIIPPLIAVIPGLNSANNHVPSLGIDMVGSWNKNVRGLGTGRFWQYLTGELFPDVERTYARQLGDDRLGVGFSLGGYTLSLITMKLPRYLSHVGIYDGLFMWPDNADPRVNVRRRNSDPIWGKAAIFDAAFGNPRDEAALKKWNPTDMLVHAPPAELDQILQTTFHIASAPNDGRFGNVDRARRFVRLLKERGATLTFDGVVFDSEATHSWHWTDRFLISFLSGYRSRYQTALSVPGR